MIVGGKGAGLVGRSGRGRVGDVCFCFKNKHLVIINISLGENGLGDYHLLQQYFSHVRSDGRVITKIALLFESEK